jgi:hypothetical protein
MADHAPRYQLPAAPGVQTQADSRNIYRGGQGFRTAQFDLGRRGSKVLKDGGRPTGILHLSSLRHLRDVDTLVFIDGRETFDPDDPAAQVMRIYRVALGRMADQGGLAGAVSAMEAGARLSSLADGLVSSKEFAVRHGEGLDSLGFVSALYGTMRGLVPLPAEVAGWVTQIDEGRLTRGEILVAIANSSENRERTADLLAQGIWVRNEKAVLIANLWRAAFDRLPSRPGLARWISRVHVEALPMQAVAEAFHAEAANLPVTLDDTAFVHAVHQNVLGRDAELHHLEIWVRHLQQRSLSRPELLLAMAESPQTRDITAHLFQSDRPDSYGITLVN